MKEMIPITISAKISKTVYIEKDDSDNNDTLLEKALNTCISPSRCFSMLDNLSKQLNIDISQLIDWEVTDENIERGDKSNSPNTTA